MTPSALRIVTICCPAGVGSDQMTMMSPRNEIRPQKAIFLVSLPHPTHVSPHAACWQRTLDLLSSASPDQSFCTDRKNLHCHFSYGLIIAEPRLDFGF